MAAAATGAIRVGIGGWDYDPWRKTFYPPGLAKAKQLEYAARHVTAIEINATYYKLQKPELFAKWRDAVPAGFRFAIKGSRFCSNRRVLGEAGEAVERFCGQGLAELGDKLGPILWQFMTTKVFDPDDFAAFLALLPKAADGVPLAHVVEPRHESFRTPVFVDMARKAKVAIVFADSDQHPCLADLTGEVAYARLQRSRAEEPTGYPPEALDRWAAVARGWSRGETSPNLPICAPPAPSGPRDTYVFFISGAKERNPAAAMALLERLS
ncbi:MAG: hypothetical protein QOH04_990 [Sphingomonadales bacterium]|jgi:uncharacterized protein YecE (DUF72 family)|nr:hypothetical protein [Sphingomonadales bacterium]